MSKKKIGPSDFQAEVKRLQAAGKFPSLDEVLDAVADARAKFAGKILKVREQATLQSNHSLRAPQRASNFKSQIE